ncbi:branched-chain amino acid ABC transporter permease [Paracoccus sp. J56]|uniref:branched-chain amino acid ABC transporter permease n=1 Tax=Paracoccus sp. J56 TaxID=935850 RepID=UPI000A0A169A|nr:branched-chain amino acid ABC transporter permease [Paracoccus sp. J56]SMG19642.1 amino acid/amide ABC transporter membrane protein 2, HAAT family [Paracoccus sp. J56]
MMKYLSLIIILAGAYLAVPLQFGGNDYVIGIVVSALTIAGIAVAWAMLGNLGGMISFGHSAFFGVGAYGSALLAMNAGLPVFPSILAGGVIAGVVSILTMPTLRLRGPYFALAMLAFAEIFRILAIEMRWLTNGSGGLLSIPRLQTVFGFDFGSRLGGYFVVLTLVLLTVFVYWLIRNRPEGLALRAMHDSEDATLVVGVNATRLKAAVLVVSAFLTGIMGAFNAHYINFLEPDYAFNGSWTTLAIVAAIFGGYKTLWGPVAGALIVYLVDQFVFKAIMPSGHQLILGGLLAAIVIFSPSGLLPWLASRFRKEAGDAAHP